MAVRIWILASVLAVSLSPLAPALAGDYSGDMATVREFLDTDQSYSQEERAQAVAELKKLEARASDMSLAAFQLAVAHIAALSGNGHTMLLPGVWPYQFNRTPLEYYAFAGGLFVVHAPPEMRELLGARVTAIEGRSVEELTEAFGRYFGARSGKRDEWVGFFLESPAILHAAGLAGSEDRLDVQFELANGSTITRTLPGALDPPKGEMFDFLDSSRLVTLAAENIAAPGSIPLYLGEPDRAFRMAPLPEIDAEYIQLRLNKSFYEQKIETFLASARTTLEKTKPRNVVVDLRQDGGGDLNTTRAFMQALPSLVAADGRIFVLTSGRTFSAGIASAGYLEQAAPTRVTIVGEPVGDYLEFWAEGGLMQLPVSKAVLLPATERHNYTTGCPEPDCHIFISENPIRIRSLEPDIAAPLTYADYRAGRDPALAAVYEALGR